jgi:hypothetical protein
MFPARALRENNSHQKEREREREREKAKKRGGKERNAENAGAI